MTRQNISADRQALSQACIASKQKHEHDIKIAYWSKVVFVGKKATHTIPQNNVTADIVREMYKTFGSRGVSLCTWRQGISM